MKCKARVVTDLVNGEQMLIKSAVKHNHPINVKRRPRKLGSRETDEIDVKIEPMEMKI